jgi:hypothetical protein
VPVLALALLLFAPTEVPVLPLAARVVDRTTDELYAATGTALHAYSYGAREWREVLSREDRVGDVRVARSGHVLLVDRAERVSPAGEEVAVPALQDVWRARLVRVRDLWFVCGASGSGPLEGAGSLHSRPVGEGVEGILLASPDEGATWVELDRWPGGAVDDVHLGDDGELVLLRANGGIRRGVLGRADGDLEVELTTLVNPDSFEVLRPYTDYRARLLFPDEEHGFVVGAMYYERDRVFETNDGGATWAETKSVFEVEADPFGDDNSIRGSLRLDSRAFVAVTRSGLQRWNGEAFEDLGRGSRFYFERTLVDARGALLVELENGQVWAYDTRGEWAPVAVLRGQELESPWKDE